MYKKLFIQSLGCPKNLVDSEIMLGLLSHAGCEVSNTPEDADLLLINTCGFIQSAVEESIDNILYLAGIKEAYPDKKLVITGCLVQRYGEKLRNEIPEADLIIGTDGFQNIVKSVANLQRGMTAKYKFRIPKYLQDSSTPRRISTPAHRAYLKITEGCSNRCSYCLIPSIRGPMRSRQPSDLVREATWLSDSGVKELTLIAQDLTAYGSDLTGNISIEALLKSILNNCNIPWIRLLYLHPLRLRESLLELMVAEPRILPYLDIPMQHVNNRILRAMNRQYNREYLETLVGRIRRMLPNAAIRTTFLVGFPGETEEDVAEIEEFIRAHMLEHVGVFTYSNEDGCAAQHFPHQCPEHEKHERRRNIMKIQADIALEHNKRLVGKVEHVLVEGLSSESDLLLEGRTRSQAPDIDGCVYVTAGHCNAGDLVNVRITEAHPYDLVGEIV